MTTVASALPSSNGTAVQANGGLVQVQITLLGITPLLMNAMSEAQLIAIRDKVKPPKNAAKPALRDEAANKVHQLHDGSPCLPTRALFGSFINAGQFIRLDGKRQISTATKTVLPGMMAMLSLELPLYKPDTKKAATWEVDIQQGKNPNGGEAVCIVRPRFDEWELHVEIEVDQTQMPLAQARELIDLAGKRIGLLDFRPQRRGTFGRFVVKNWKVASNAQAA